MHGITANILLDPREYWSGLDRQSRVLAVSVAVSILLHAVLLTIHFRFPEALRWKSESQPLEVILVNSKFWAGLVDWIKGQLLSDGMIGIDDPDLIRVIDDPQAVVDAIFDHYHTRGFEPSPAEREAELAL